MQSTVANFRLRIIRDDAELESVRGPWEALCRHPNAQIDFFRLICRVRPEVEGPWVLVMERGGEVEAMLIARRETIQLECRLGYKTLLRPRLRAITVIQGGWLGADEPQAARAAVGALMDALKSGEADVAMFSPLSTQSQLFQNAQALPSAWRRSRMAVPSPHFIIRLPGTMDELLGRLRSKHRYWIRRMEKLLNKEFEGRIWIERFRHPEQVERMCRHVEAVAAKTYHRRLGFGFVYNEEMARRMDLAACRGWLRALVLYVGDEPKAFWITTLYRGVCFLTYTGYDPALRQFEPGTTLIMKLFEWMIEERVPLIDCGQGAAFYKQRFGEEDGQEAIRYIFAPRPRSIALNVLVTTFDGVSAGLKRLLDWLGLLQRIKTRWRARAASADDGAESESRESD